MLDARSRTNGTVGLVWLKPCEKTGIKKDKLLSHPHPRPSTDSSRRMASTLQPAARQPAAYPGGFKTTARDNFVLDRLSVSPSPPQTLLSQRSRSWPRAPSDSTFGCSLVPVPGPARRRRAPRVERVQSPLPRDAFPALDQPAPGAWSFLSLINHWRGRAVAGGATLAAAGIKSEIQARKAKHVRPPGGGKKTGSGEELQSGIFPETLPLSRSPSRSGSPARLPRVWCSPRARLQVAPPSAAALPSPSLRPPAWSSRHPRYCEGVSAFRRERRQASCPKLPEEEAGVLSPQPEPARPPPRHRSPGLRPALHFPASALCPPAVSGTRTGASGRCPYSFSPSAFPGAS